MRKSLFAGLAIVALTPTLCFAQASTATGAAAGAATGAVVGGPVGAVVGGVAGAAVTVNVAAADVPPPGVATVMACVPLVVTSLAGSTAVNSVADP